MFFRFRYFLEGAMPDELKQLNAQQLQNTKLLRTKLSRLQVKGIVITPKSDLWINFETTSVTRLTVECHLVTPWTQLLEKKFPYKPDFQIEHDDSSGPVTCSVTFWLNTMISVV